MRNFKIKIPCTECHNAMAGVACIFCNGTKEATIAAFDMASHERSLRALQESETPILDSYEEELVDGKWERKAEPGKSA